MKHIIIGNGVAGMTAALELTKAGAEVHLYTQETHAYYYRPQVTNYLAGIMPLEKVLLRSVEWYAEKGIYLHLGTTVTQLRPEAHHIVLGDGAVMNYDRLLYATGSSPFVPPIPGREKRGVFTIRTLGDAQAIREYAANCREAVVVGGGLLGLEAARGLQGLGLRITLVELQSRLMPLQLDTEGAAILKPFVEQQGFDVRLENSVHAILGEAAVTGVELRDGQQVPAQLVVVAAGVRPNTALAEAAGLEVFRGVCVDDMMRTNVPDIYAAGDAAIYKDRCWAIVPTAQAQARVAAANMLDGDVQYKDVPPITALKVMGIEVNAMGDMDPDGDEYTILRRADAAAFSYKKLVWYEGRLMGAIVIGDKSLAKQLEGLLTNRTPLSQAEAEALLESQ